MTSFQYRAIGSTRVNNIHHRSDIENPAQHSKERKNHASHAPFLTDEDQKSLRENDLFVSITPESEFHFGHGQTSGRQITDQTSLGVDTNWNFFFPGDILSQTRLWIQYVRSIQLPPDPGNRKAPQPQIPSPSSRHSS